MIAVCKHELSSHFHSLTAYIFSAFFLAFVGLGAMLYNIQSAVANFEYVLSFVCLGFVVIIPILTMKAVAEERRQKTDQLLYSLPITASQIMIGKYLALLVVYLVPLVVISFYPLIFAMFAFFMMGAAFIAIGMFISSLTDNLGFAAGIAILVILLNYYSVTLAEYVSSTAIGSAAALIVAAVILGFVIRYLTRNDKLAVGTGAILSIAVAGLYVMDSAAFEGLLPDIMKKLSLFERFYKFVNGVFDLTGIVYYVTVTVFFLFLSVQSLEKRRYN